MTVHPLTVRHLDLADYLTLVDVVTGLGVATVVRMADVRLADSALHAPRAGWSDFDLYPDFVDKAAVLTVRLTQNHALPDGNKRAGWVALRLFVELNGWAWTPYPSVDDAEAAMLSVASGEWDETAMAEWLRPRLRPTRTPASPGPHEPVASVRE
jgi:death-on-curing protein